MFRRPTLVAQLGVDTLRVRDLDSGLSHELTRDLAQRSPRLLVGDFTVAQQEFKTCLKALRRGLLAPRLLVHAMERVEGGLTQVEQRVLIELGLGAGASRVVVHTGPELSPDAVRARLEKG